MKHTNTLLLCLLFALPLSIKAQDISLNGTDYQIDTLEYYVAGPGTECLSARMTRTSDGGGRLDVYILRADLTNQYLTMQQELGSGKLVGTERPTAIATRVSTPTHIAFAGTNGDFFVTQGDVGKPVGFTIGSNQYATTTGTSRHAGGMTAKGKAIVANTLKFSGKLQRAGEADLTIKHVNYNREENELVLYNYHNGTSTGTNAYGTELQIALADGEQWKTHGSQQVVVTKKEQNVGNMALDADHAVLSAHGTMQTEIDKIEVGDTLTIKFTLKVNGKNTNISEMVGGDNYVLIVDSGRVPQSGYWDELHPRTGFGTSMTGDTAYLCVVDGRGKSIGCTTKVLGEIMNYFGAWSAVNWDGGGSSCLFVQPFGQINVASDGSERSVANAMLLVAEIPEEDNNLSTIMSLSPTLLLPQYGIATPKFLGYNQYGVLIDTDVKDVVLTCDEQTGYIDGNGRFVCMGNGVLTAHKGDITTTMQVRVVNDVAPSIRLDTVWISDDTDYPIEVITTIGKNTVLLHGSALTWQVKDNAVCSVTKDGVLNGMVNDTTVVYGTINGQTDSLIAIVQIPETKPLAWSEEMSKADSWQLTAAKSTWNAKIVNTPDLGTHINFTYQQVRNAYLRLNIGQELYGVPRAMEFLINPQDLPLDRVAINMKAHNQQAALTHTVRGLQQNEMNSILIDLDSMFAAKGDIAIHPVFVNQIAIYLQADATEKEYNILLGGIRLHYNSITVDVINIEQNSMSIIPSQAEDKVMIICEQETTVRLYDIMGHLLVEQPTSNREAELMIDGLGQGTYIIQADNQTAKILKH